jgi:hypothetical protein
MDSAAHQTPTAQKHHLGTATGLGLAAIGIGLLALADNLHLTEMRLLHTLWPLALVLLGLGKLLGGSRRGHHLGGLALVVVGSVLTATKLGAVDPLQLRQWWPLLPIVAGGLLLWKAWQRRS